MDWDFARDLETIRRNWSATLEPMDPSGVLRALFLTESRPDHHEGLFRSLGCVHLLRATGIHLYATYRSIRWTVDLLSICAAGFGVRVPSIALGRCVGITFVLWGWILSGMRPGMIRRLVVVGLRWVVMILGG
jgi:hypothetical protein